MFTVELIITYEACDEWCSIVPHFTVEYAEIYLCVRFDIHHVQDTGFVVSTMHIQLRIHHVYADSADNSSCSF
jgi:hypothetical protein